ncbi:MAG TPA: hypothetical protein DEP35_18365 [Deltaproteobacteria bacterium]|nr:hypothetical protein [Deltaproteobacteria bacterium]
MPSLLGFALRIGSFDPLAARAGPRPAHFACFGPIRTWGSLAPSRARRRMAKKSHLPFGDE